MYRGIEIKVNGRSKIAVALIDSGCDETIISERLAKRLNLKLYGNIDSSLRVRTRGRFCNSNNSTIKTSQETSRTN